MATVGFGITYSGTSKTRTAPSHNNSTTNNVPTPSATRAGFSLTHEERTALVTSPFAGEIASCEVMIDPADRRNRGLTKNQFHYDATHAYCPSNRSDRLYLDEKRLLY